MYDEYHLAKTAQLWYLNVEHARTITPIPGAGEPAFPNSLFFAIYQFAFAFGTSFYTVAKLLNVALVAVSAYAAARVAGMFTDRKTAGWIGVAVLWMPATGYAIGFMAEPLYESIVWVGLWAFFALLVRDTRIASAAMGAFVAAAYLTKPTAAVLLVTANAATVVAAACATAKGSRFKHVAASLAALNVSFLASGFVLNALLTGSLMWDPIGNYYRQDLAKAFAVEADNDFFADATRYVSAYVFFVLLVFGPAVTTLVSGIRGAGRTVRLAALSSFACVGMGLLILGTSKASMNWERVYEGGPHIYSTRYMSVLFPLLLIAYAGFRSDAAAAVNLRRAVGAVIAVIVAALAFAFVNVENSIQLREVFWTRGWPAAVYVFAAMACVFVACTAYHAFAKRPRATVYAGMLVGWIGVSTLGLFRLDWWTSTDWLGPSDRAGTVAASLVAPAARDDGLVVYDHNWRASAFMFRYPGFVPLRKLPSGSVVERSSIPATVKWVVFLGPVRPASRDERCVGMQDALWCPLSSDAAMQPPVPPQ